VRGDGPRPCHRSSSRLCQRGQSSHPEMRQILQLGQIREFQEEGVDGCPASKVEEGEEDPEEAHEDVVGENHVVQNGREEEGKEPPHCKHKHRDQPGNHLRLMLLPQGLNELDARHKKDQAPDHGEYGDCYQCVSYMSVAHVDKVKRDEVVAVVRRPWRGFAQAVEVEAGDSNSEQAQENGIESSINGQLLNVMAQNFLRDPGLPVPRDVDGLDRPGGPQSHGSDGMDGVGVDRSSPHTWGLFHITTRHCNK